ncbi:aminoglycoside phosphotransferase family protein [Sulfitobacter donghicola]|uniref:Aminoglycoside phosphotransferase n=1 Tax=Sulfitobacter donghicola DSW-25 = KCTC 12864 = JCM 14565 TaxID=1300350 RepID=A0A073IJZ3_9RHOB|nr:phosphotransferase [Sulfitobacter donghicola]KEJ90628.1 aminoglycoside phosphotransferase [Sulfitobacter donghicola DSW-25 = KCTC 12864 = JCM 14565]KIN67877.1 Aminoglycoside phosphotransferase [Sulfitobacter donghicola DSW-25 = KCTC 12864 = JCM 14565]
MTNRAHKLTEFIRTSGWQDAARETVAGDASNRRYERLTMADGASIILMDAPSDKGEDVRPFIAIAEHLRSIGLSAPEIVFRDIPNGFLLIEDLGDDLFKRVISRDPALEVPLYEASVDVLTALHAKPFPQLEPYDTATMTNFAARAYEWYLFGLTGMKDTPEQAQFEQLMSQLLEPLERETQVLIQRDYHAENLLWLPDRSGAARVGLLDFQDAMSGHPAYDLVSILQDARRDVPVDIESDMIARYLSQNPQDEEAFRAAYAILGVQRNLRIVGAFAKLCIDIGKPRYIDLIPRVWEFVERNLKHPALAPIADHVLSTIPQPTAENLATLKAKCAS